MSAGDLLAFLASGLVHGFGNALFALRGGADALLATKDQGQDPRFEKIQGLLVNGCVRAADQLTVLRAVGAPNDAAGASVPWTDAVDMAIHTSQIPIRDRGQVLDWSPRRPQSEPATIGTASGNPATVIRAVVATIALLSDALPKPGPDRIRIREADGQNEHESLPRWGHLMFETAAIAEDMTPPPLPFGFDMQTLSKQLSESLRSLVGDRAHCESRGGVLHLAIRLTPGTADLDLGLGAREL